MSVTVESTTDSKEAVLAASGHKTPQLDQVKDKKPAPTPKKDGEIEASTQEAAKDTEPDESIDTEVDEDDQDLNSSDESETEESESDDDTEKVENPKKAKGFQKKIKKLVGRLSEKDREIEYWKNAALSAKKTDVQPEAIEKTKADQKTLEASKPRSDQFETNEEYVDALTDWKLQQMQKENAEKEKQAKLKTEFESKAQTFQQKVETFKTEHQDFDDLMEAVDDIPISVNVQDAILASDDGPALMYELAKNRDLYKKINGMNRDRAFLEIGKIEARIQKSSDSTQSKEAKPTTTKAPPPIKPVGTSGTASAQKSPDDMTFNEYKKWRESQKS